MRARSGGAGSSSRAFWPYGAPFREGRRKALWARSAPGMYTLFCGFPKAGFSWATTTASRFPRTRVRPGGIWFAGSGLTPCTWSGMGSVSWPQATGSMPRAGMGGGVGGAFPLRGSPLWTFTGMGFCPGGCILSWRPGTGISEAKTGEEALCPFPPRGFPGGRWRLCRRWARSSMWPPWAGGFTAARTGGLALSGSFPLSRRFTFWRQEEAGFTSGGGRAFGRGPRRGGGGYGRGRFWRWPFTLRGVEGWFGWTKGAGSGGSFLERRGSKAFFHPGGADGAERARPVEA